MVGRKDIDEDLYEELEEVLIQADVGVNTALELMDRVRKGIYSDFWLLTPEYLRRPRRLASAFELPYFLLFLVFVTTDFIILIIYHFTLTFKYCPFVYD